MRQTGVSNNIEIKLAALTFRFISLTRFQTVVSANECPSGLVDTMLDLEGGDRQFDCLAEKCYLTQVAKLESNSHSNNGARKSDHEHQLHGSIDDEQVEDETELCRSSLQGINDVFMRCLVQWGACRSHQYPDIQIELNQFLEIVSKATPVNTSIRTAFSILSPREEHWSNANEVKLLSAIQEIANEWESNGVNPLSCEKLLLVYASIQEKLKKQQ